MGRVKRQNPQSVSASDTLARRCHGRGRPRIEWTASRTRKLLRLYLGMPASLLSLQDIRDLLSHGDFKPA